MLIFEMALPGERKSGEAVLTIGYINRIAIKRLPDVFKNLKLCLIK